MKMKTIDGGFVDVHNYRLENGIPMVTYDIIEDDGSITEGIFFVKKIDDENCIEIEI